MNAGAIAWLVANVIYWFVFLTYIRAYRFMVCPPNPFGTRIRQKLFIASFDMWIGTYLDKPNKVAYWFPIPCVGIKMWREVKTS